MRVNLMANLGCEAACSSGGAEDLLTFGEAGVAGGREEVRGEGEETLLKCALASVAYKTKHS